MRATRGSGSGKALYTSSTLALAPDTGKLAWYYQHVGGETLDLDEVFERVLVDSDGQKLVFTIGKPGILWKLDRVTGKYLERKETIFQNVFDQFDEKTGEPTISRGYSGTADGPVGAGLSQHRRRPQLASHELPPANEPTHHSP